MSFSDQVKTEVLILCDRYCCKCREKCGVNIEAAHIVAKADGGANTTENCIPLCFKCHADIGHYNDKHPKGNKFRPPELIAMRDQTYAWVAAKKAAEVGTVIKTPESTESPRSICAMEERALTFVWKGERVTARDVAVNMGISVDRAKIYLHELEAKHRLVDWIGNMDTKETSYILNNLGRRLLFERGIIQ